MYTYTQPYYWKIIRFLIALLFVMGLPYLVVNHLVVALVIGLVAVPLSLSFFLRLWKKSADLVIDEQGISESMTGLKLRRRTIPWEDIEKIKIEEVSLFWKDFRSIFGKKHPAQIKIRISPACWKRLHYTRLSSVGQNVAKQSHPYEVIIPLWDWGTDSPKARDSIKRYRKG